MSLTVSSTPTPSSGTLPSDGTWSTVIQGDDTVFTGSSIVFQDEIGGPPPYAVRVLVKIGSGSLTQIYTTDGGFSSGYTGTDGVSGHSGSAPISGSFSFKPISGYPSSVAIQIQIQVHLHSNFSGQNISPSFTYNYTSATTYFLSLTSTQGLASQDSSVVNPLAGASGIECGIHDGVIGTYETYIKAIISDNNHSSNVQLSSINMQVTVGGTPQNAIISGVIQSGWDGGGGYGNAGITISGYQATILVSPTGAGSIHWSANESVTVSIQASTDTGDTLSTSFSFTTGDPDGPFLSSQSPADGATNIPTNQTVSFKVDEAQASVASSPLTVTVDPGNGTPETVYSGGAFQGIYIGSGSTRTPSGNGYVFSITRPGGWFGNVETVSFTISARDTSSPANIETLTYSFTTEPIPGMTFAPNPSSSGAINLSTMGSVVVTETGVGLGDPVLRTLSYQINGTGPSHSIYSGGSFQLGWGGSITSLGGQSVRISFEPTGSVPGDPRDLDTLDFAIHSDTTGGDPGEDGSWSWIVSAPMTPWNRELGTRQGRIAVLGTQAFGFITPVDGSLLVDGDTFTVSDGVRSVTFEYDSDHSVTGSNIPIQFYPTDTIDDVLFSTVEAFKNAPIDFSVAAFLDPSVPGEISLINTNYGSIGNVDITESVSDPGFIVTGMSGGVDADVSLLDDGIASAPEGSFVFVLGYKHPGLFHLMRAGDYSQVAQTADLSSDTVFRCRAIVRPTLDMPSGLAWRLSLRLDGIEYVGRILNPKRRRDFVDLAINTNGLTGSHEVSMRLELVSA